MVIQLKKTIAQAFVAAGLVKDTNAVDQSYFLAVQKRNAALSEAFLTDERDKEFNKKHREGNIMSTQLLSPEGNQCASSSCSIDHKHPQYKLALHAAAEKFFQTSFVIPAQELREVLQEQDKFKKQRIKKNQRDTKTGRAVTAYLIEILREQEEQKARAERAKDEARVLVMDKKVAARVRQQEAGAALLEAHRSGDGSWQNQPVDKLKSAYKN